MESVCGVLSGQLKEQKTVKDGVHVADIVADEWSTRDLHQSAGPHKQHRRSADWLRNKS